MHDAIYSSKNGRKEETKMKTTLARKAAYIGAGAGLVLFAIFGLLPGSLLGGAAGIKVAGMLFGLPLEPGIVSRSIVLLSMLVGVLVSGIAIVTAASTAGWLVGNVIGAAAGAPLRTAEERVRIRRN
jgi:small-conductance mechanosensitive channel